ncbi:hypothetical protein [Mycolicibacterium hippocampi]|uniref:DUF7159 domain-containing protein n=1 Tax=Mycolicibacterium hippocampi TaxID=659824 RepID=A0A7I9ZQH7_9MYCO|nr:hypothetical protein [Mycolicibacterium hippocampi]GFH03292.1 hypothetical protein MHIP_37750 [Mycolicibacterium hippocampi]
MRLVLGVSLTASSAVWVLVDTVNGKILAEEVVNLDSVDEIARATARSVQAFDMQTEHDVEGVRMTWSDDARQHGIRLRTKLRLFGFEIVESVSEDAAREGRNKTARHLAPHLALAYGAARADLHGDDGRGVLRRLAGRVPIRVAAAVCAVALVGVGLSAFVTMSPSDPPVSTAAEATPPQPELPVQPIRPAPPAPAAAPQAAAPQDIAPQAVSPTEVPEPSATPEPVAAWQPATTEAQPEVAVAAQDTAEALTDPTVPAAAAAVQATTPTAVGVPHLPGARPVVGPAQAQPAPAAPRPAPVAPKPVNNLAPPPPPLPPVLSSLFDALP